MDCESFLKFSNNILDTIHAHFGQTLTTETSRRCGTNPRVSKAQRKHYSRFKSGSILTPDSCLLTSGFPLFWSSWTPLCRTIKTMSRTKASRSCGTNRRVSKALRFFTIHQLPVTSHILDTHIKRNIASDKTPSVRFFFFFFHF